MLYDLAQDSLLVVTQDAARSLNLGPSSVRAGNLWHVQIMIYKMRGRDAILNDVYTTWLVSGAPDLLAQQYRGGLNRPLRDVVVIDCWPAH